MFSGYGSPLITSNLRITRANWLTRLTDLANSGFGGETLPQRKWNNIPNINLKPPKPIYIHKNIHPIDTISAHLKKNRSLCTAQPDFVSFSAFINLTSGMS